MQKRYINSTLFQYLSKYHEQFWKSQQSRILRYLLLSGLFLLMYNNNNNNNNNNNTNNNLYLTRVKTLSVNLKANVPNGPREIMIQKRIHAVLETKQLKYILKINAGFLDVQDLSTSYNMSHEIS